MTQRDDDAPDLFDFHGLKVQVGSDAECAAADYLICCPTSIASPFPDNQIRSCVICGCDCWVRPYMPTGPKVVCLDCFPKVATPSA